MTTRAPLVATGLATLLVALGAVSFSGFRDQDSRPRSNTPGDSAPPEKRSDPRSDDAERDGERPARSVARDAQPLSRRPPAGWTVSGRVLKDGSPATDVEVRLKEQPREPKGSDPIAERTVRTDRAGLFVVPGVPGGRAFRLEIDEPRSALRVESFELKEAKRERSLHLGDLRLEPPHSMRLKIVGSDGMPVAGVWVLADRSRTNGVPARKRLQDASREVPENGNGEYALDRVPAGSWKIHVVAEGFAYRPNQSVHVELPQEEPLLVTLDAGAWLIGSVWSTEGKPIPDAEVDAIDCVEGQHYRGVKTDAMGRFEMGFLVSGNYWVTAAAPGFALERRANVPAGTADVDFTLPREAVLSGTVVAENGGNPVRGATVSLRSPVGRGGITRREARTDAQGRYTIDRIQPGKFLVSVQHDGFVPTGETLSIELKEGERAEDEVIRLKRGLGAAGRVIDSATGEPIAAARVHFHYLNPAREERVRHSDDRKSATTGPDGTFLLKILPEGEHEVSWEAEGYVRPIRETVSVTGHSIEGLVLALDRETSRPRVVRRE